jgi:hypothetical protein
LLYASHKKLQLRKGGFDKTKKALYLFFAEASGAREVGITMYAIVV